VSAATDTVPTEAGAAAVSALRACARGSPSLQHGTAGLALATARSYYGARARSGARGDEHDGSRYCPDIGEAAANSWAIDDDDKPLACRAPRKTSHAVHKHLPCALTDSRVKCVTAGPVCAHTYWNLDPMFGSCLTQLEYTWCKMVFTRERY
jgi:hypothetical protein